MSEGKIPQGNSQQLKFADFTVDLHAGELHQNGARVRLQDQPFQVLALLTQRAGTAVTREELRRHLWPADTFVDFDNSLNAAVAKIREALGDSPEEPLFIETLPRRGYRFIATVHAAEESFKRPASSAIAPFEVAAKRHWVRWQWVGAVGLAIIAIAALWALRSPRPPKVVRYVQITNDGAPKVRISVINTLATDGSRIYFSRGARNGWEVAQVSVAGGEVVPFPESFTNGVLEDISTDRSSLLFSPSEGTTLDATLWLLPIPGGTARRLGNLRAHGASWSPDGKLIAFCKDRDLYLANADGTEARKLAALSGIPYRPRWSPDGSVVSFYLYDDSRDLGSLWEVAADGTNPHRLLPHWNDGSDECCGAWTADGKYFVFQATRDRVTSIWALPQRHGIFTSSNSQPLQLTPGPMNFSAPSPSPDGKQLFVIGEQKRGELMRYDAPSRRFVTYLSGISAEGLDFSRDGEWVVYAAYPEGSLWRSKVDGSQRLQLTNSSMQAGSPRWSPDGKRIAFIARKAGENWKSYLVSADGGTPEKLLLGEESEFDLGWSPDGNSLIFGPLWLSSWLSPTAAIRFLDLRTRRVSTLPGSEGLCSPRWSPDGRFVAAMTKDSRTLKLFDFTTRKWRELVRRDSLGYLTWSHSGEYIYFNAATEVGVFFYRVRARDHKLEQVATMPPPIGLAFGLFGPWTGLAPDDSPLLMRDTSIQEVYALDWQLP